MGASETIETIRTSWGSTNDGVGSGLNADMVDGLSSESFLRAQVELNLNLMIEPGFYGGVVTNNPLGSDTTGTAIVTRGANSDAINQVYMDSESRMFKRFGIGTPTVFQGWTQLGAMTFDGIVLQITL